MPDILHFFSFNQTIARLIRPPALPPGARIALVAPAGPLAPGAVERAVDRVRAFGWEPVAGRHARGRHGYLAGTDAERLEDLNQAICADDNQAIWCLRGGYGTMRLLNQVRWDALVHRPRPLIGFSDNTALHLALQRRGMVSFHGPHPATAAFPEFSESCFRAVVTHPEPAGVLPFPADGPGRAETIVGGAAAGPLVGGNLSLVAATLGTSYTVRAEGALLFLEEVGEPTYRVDRLLSQLLLAGVFDSVAGVVLGAFSDTPETGETDLPSPADVVLDRLSHLRVPVAFGFPFGHIEESWTLPLGVRARLDADAGTLEILEPAVTESAEF